MVAPPRSDATPLPVAVVPDTRPAMHAAFSAAVVAGGGIPVGLADAEALVWADPAAVHSFPELIAQAPRVSWIQLPYAGIEPFASYLDARFTWTCGKGVYAQPVAEHALGLALAGLRCIGAYARATRWSEAIGTNLIGANVVILGGGGIAESLLALLAPFRTVTTVVRRSNAPVPGADRVVGHAQMGDVLGDAHLVVIALALTPETTGIVEAHFLASMRRDAWLVNVGRGAHVVTADLVAALRAGTIAGAALDVTDPEPLPPGHPLWALANCIVTPHVANTPEMGLPLIAERVRDNVARRANGQALLGLVDVARGY
jgi:phosphoglycerate dehydrogenase-like enzyme